MEALIENFFNLAIMREAWPFLLQGLGMTVVLSLVVVPVGLAGGFALALLSTVRRRWLAWALIAYVDVFRAFPPLVLLIFIYFGLPFLRVDISPFGAVVLAFLLNTSSYYGEIFRAGLESVGRGQSEAARSTGLSALQELAHVVVPQAVRNVVPDLIGNTLEVIKLTSLASVVALPELLHAARSAQAVTYNPSPLVLAAAIYLVLLWPLVRLLSRFEHRMLAAR